MEWTGSRKFNFKHAVRKRPENQHISNIKNKVAQLELDQSGRRLVVGVNMCVVLTTV